jgi:hypothetical protein
VLFDGSPRAGQWGSFSSGSGSGSLCIKAYGNSGVVEYQIHDGGL